MRKLLSLLTIIFLTSCDFGVPKPATEEQKKKAMADAKFDQTIIKDLNKYDELKDFLTKYGDTIVSYRNNKNYVIEVDSTGKMDTVLQKQDCYNFFQGNSAYDITNVPNFLKAELDGIYNKIGDKNIKSFEICKDKKIRIEVRDEGGENGLYISHDLLWNSKMENNYRYSDNKDTLINGNCVYRIGMTEHHGH